MNPPQLKPVAQRVAVVAALAVALLLAPIAAQAQVVQQAPADSLVVIKFNKLKPTSDKIAAFAQKLGIAQFQPALGNPLGMMQQKMGITQGLDAQGEAAIVLVNGPMNEAAPPALLILPVTDYNAFLKNFPGARQEDNVTVAKMKGENDDSFIMKRGNYAVLAPKRQYLQLPAGGLAPGALAAKELQGKDIVAFVNMKSARNRILPELRKNRGKILADVERNFKAQAGAAGGPAARRSGPNASEPGANAAAAPATGPAKAADAQQKMLPLVRALVNRGLDLAEQVVNDADSATYGWNFADAGLQVTGLVEFAANSPSAQRVGQLKNTDESLLKGLPQTKYWFYGGTSGNNTAAVGQMINDFLAPVDREFAALGADGKPLQDYLAAIRSYITNAKGQSAGWVAPSGMLGQEAIVQVVSVIRGDAPKLIENTQKMFDAQQAFMGGMGGPMGPASGLMKQTYTPNAKAVDGVQFNLMQTTIAPPAPGQPRTAQQMQAQQMITFMHGPGGMNVYVGAADANHVISATGANDALLKQLVASGKADQDVLGQQPPVKATASQLPPQRLAGWFVQIDQIATGLAAYAKAFGMPINFQVPQNLAPLGATVSTDGAAVRVDGYAPTQTLQSVIAAGIQTYMQMQGGQQPGGGPGGL